MVPTVEGSVATDATPAGATRQRCGRVLIVEGIVGAGDGAASTTFRSELKSPLIWLEEVGNETGPTGLM